MFIRTKGRNHYLVESARINGSVRQKVLAYLGTAATVREAIEAFRKSAATHREKAKRESRRMPWVGNIQGSIRKKEIRIQRYLRKAEQAAAAAQKLQKFAGRL